MTILNEWSLDVIGGFNNRRARVTNEFVLHLHEDTKLRKRERRWKHLNFNSNQGLYRQQRIQDFVRGHFEDKILPYGKAPHGKG